jgi:glycerophosphoryl diester phosphodiesterase
MNYTKNYKFKKPEPLETRNIDDINYNSDLMDATLKKVEDSNSNLDATFQQLIINAGSSNAEIVAGRHDNVTGQTFSSLPERLDKHSSDITTKAAQLSLDQETQERLSEVNVERQRINNLIAVSSSTDNAETADIRVGADGKTYGSAGEAVRSQVAAKANQTDLEVERKRIDLLKSNESPTYKSIIDWNKIANREYYNTPSDKSVNDTYWNSGIRPVLPNTTYVAWKSSATFYLNRVVYLDINKAYLSYSANVNQFTTPNNCYYVVISRKYTHDGANVTYADGVGIYGFDYDDFINKGTINVGTASSISIPFSDYLTDDIKVKYNVNKSANVINVRDAVRGSASVLINPAVFSGSITIRVTGSNVFDGVTGNGYIDSSTGAVLSSDATKYNVNPIYVNENDYIIFSKNCRVTEFDANGTVVNSMLADARKPFLTDYNTRYIRFHCANDLMSAIYVNIGKTLTGAAEAYISTDIVENVRTWTTSSYNVPVKLLSGINNIFVVSTQDSKIQLTYNQDIILHNDIENNESNDLNVLNYLSGIKLANNKKYVAHRGGSDAPENTVAAYTMAFRNGFKSVESDVRFTSDNVPVMLHDASIDRTSNGSGNIAEMTFAVASSYDFGSWKDASFTGLGIPKFETFIKICSQLDLTPFIDIQVSTNITTDQIKALYDIVDAWNMLDKVIWVFSDFPGIDKLMALYDVSSHYANVFYSTSTSTNIMSILASLNWHKNTSTHHYKNVGISLNYASVADEIMATIKADNLQSAVYTVDDQQTMNTIIAKYFDYYTTDNLDVPLSICNYYWNVWK